MEVSGEVADLMVKEGLEAAKIATELSAKGLVHVAALLAAMVKQNYKVVGKVGIERLMKDRRTMINSRKLPGSSASCTQLPSMKTRKPASCTSFPT